MKYTINTKILESGIIEQTLTESIEGQIGVNQLTREIMDTKEAQVHEALIKLGWTPPSDKTEYQKYEFCKAISCWGIQDTDKCTIACPHSAKRFHHWLVESNKKIS